MENMAVFNDEYKEEIVMLHLYLDEVPKHLEDKLVNDVEKQFAKISLKCTAKEEELVRIIEQGTLINDVSFIDRFGFRLYNTELSTGCKAALCVLNSPDNIINLIECGLNARDAIISLCNVGAVLIDSNTITIASHYNSEKLYVELDGITFTNINDLNKYIFYERYNVNAN